MTWTSCKYESWGIGYGRGRLDRPRQGRASGGREMVELGHPPGNETARSIPGKVAGNLNFQDWTIKWEGNLISSSIRHHVRLFIWNFCHFWFIKHKPWLLLSVRHQIWSRGSIQNTPGGFTDFAGKIWDVDLVEAISRPRLENWIRYAFTCVDQFLLLTFGQIVNFLSQKIVPESKYM